MAIQSRTAFTVNYGQNSGVQFNPNPYFVNNCGLQTLEINETVPPPYNQHSSLPYEPNPPPYNNIPDNPPPYQENDTNNRKMVNNSGDNTV